ncbi:hypothetical protein G6514_007205 [Epicoccum nigrum]|nr:hypothetical protein G6514_007205 [Epicoccum nigrum]
MTEKKSILSPREMETLALTWQCFTTEPKYTPSSAKFTLGVIKRKLKTMADGTAAANANTNTTGAKVVKRKAAPKKKAAKGVDADDGDDEVDDEVDLKPKARAKKVKKTELESDDGDNAVMGVVVKEEVRDEEEV